MLQVTVRLIGKAGKVFDLDGCHGGTRVEEVLHCACRALGVNDAVARVRCGSRFLERFNMLDEVKLIGDNLDLLVDCSFKNGGMPVGCFSFGGSKNRPNALASAGGFVDEGVELGYPEHFSEADEYKELIDHLFKEIDSDKDGQITHEELMTALTKHDFQTELKKILEMLLGVSSAQQSISKDLFYQAFEKLPRVHGELVLWARGLHLEEHLARLLLRGDLSDGLKGLKRLKRQQLVPYVKKVVENFSEVLSKVLLTALEQLLTVGASVNAISHVNSKFVLDGAFLGNFATIDDFYAGPEKIIGTPNPKIGEGMEIEHCRRKNSNKNFTTSNYNIETTPETEWEFVVCPRRDRDYPHTPRDKTKWKHGNQWAGEHGRDMKVLQHFLDLKEVTVAGLGLDEVIGLRLYTGQVLVCFT